MLLHIQANDASGSFSLSDIMIMMPHSTFNLYLYSIPTQHHFDPSWGSSWPRQCLIAIYCHAIWTSTHTSTSPAELEYITGYIIKLY